jgi:osmoprotectant transport system substrate-binding protein
MSTTAHSRSRPTRRRWGSVTATAVLLVLVAACGDDSGDSGDTGGDGTAPPADAVDGPTISIGSQDFGESIVLAEVYGQALEANGFDTDLENVGGYRDILFGSFDSGDVNFAVDYLASELNFLAGEELATSDVDETLAELRPQLEARDMVAFTPADAVNTNVFVMTTEDADDRGISSLGDLDDDMVLGAPADCLENPFCVPGLREVYGVDLEGSFTPLETGAVVDSLRNGAVDVGVLFSTDPPLAAGDLVVLEDDEELFAADNIIPVAAADLVDAYGDELVDVVDAVTAELTTDTLIELNTRFIEDNEDADAIAADWLSDVGLVG